MPGSLGRPARIAIWFLSILLLLLAIAFALFRWCGSPPGGDRTIHFTVERGWGGRQVISALADSGLVRCSWFTLWRANSLGLLGSLQAGTYSLSSSMSPDSILRLIASGSVLPEPTHWVTLPEGLTLEQSVRRLSLSLERDSTELLSLTGDEELIEQLGLPATGFEGYLFPETYEFADSLSAHEILVRIVETGYSRWMGDSGLSLEDSPLSSSEEVVILASIVEREGRVDSERSRIASVFLNRLERGMRLESCATVQYAIGEVREELLYSDLRVEHPYNTYIHAGLPPGPICSPGISSIMAAIHPDSATGELYFVSRGDSTGLHLFARTHAEHLRNVRLVQSGGRLDP
jgi:UPF0755 protein